MPYSQFGEEEVILANTPSHGRVLEIGAWSPTVFSNSRALIERGWNAVLVEPSPAPFAGLVKFYKDNERVTLVNALAGKEWRMRKFMVTEDALSTTEQANVEKWGGAKNFREILIPEMPVLQLFDGKPFEFVTIDTEGTSFELLKMLPLDQMGTNLFCVEFDHQRDAVCEFVASKRFQVILENGANIIAKRI